MALQSVAALDSLVANMVPKLSEASRVALERAARYTVIQAASTDVAYTVLCVVLWMIGLRLFRKARTVAEDSPYGAEPWYGAACLFGIAALILSCITTFGVTSDIALFCDPVTGTIMRGLGK